jgi:acetoin:2,6-dichlorophenolindophenol oxidoreductase subunit alpha
LAAERVSDPFPPEPSPDQWYRVIRLIRRFEERAIVLVRSGEIPGGIHPYIGQEAVAAGIGAALRPDDAVLPQYRAHGHALAKGVDPAGLLAELTGRVTGVNRGRGGSLHPVDVSVGMLTATATLGHNAPQAAGVAWAFARDGSDRVAVAIYGDGSVNQGALLETFNLAALWQLPVIFVCENNGYAVSLPAERAIAGSVTARATACGIPASTHDGMDPVVVYRAVAEAVARARGGGGPAFLEFSTYRFDVHHTFEFKAGVRYRDADEVARWRLRDPVELTGKRIGDAARTRIDEDIEALLDTAERFALDSPRPEPASAFDYFYSGGVRPRNSCGQPWEQVG